nr:hypothetical protein [uncultured Roseibium sp.]
MLYIAFGNAGETIFEHVSGRQNTLKITKISQLPHRLPLEHFPTNLDHLMSISSSLGQASHEARCGASCKWHNAADGLDILTLVERIQATNIKIGRAPFRSGIVGPP